MRTFLLAFLLAASVAFAGGIALVPSVRIEFTDCASGGSSSQTVTSSLANVTFLARVTDSDVFVCYAATCASGGEKFPSGTLMLLTIKTGTVLSCRSSASAGDFILTQAY